MDVNRGGGAVINRQLRRHICLAFVVVVAHGKEKSSRAADKTRWNTWLVFCGGEIVVQNYIGVVKIQIKTTTAALANHGRNYSLW